MKLYITFLGVFCAGVLQANFLTNAWRQYHAYKAYEAGDYNQAGAEYTKMLGQDPYNALVNYNMGLVLYGQKNYELASHYFDRSVEHSKDNLLLKEQALFNQGNAYVEQKKLYEAIGSYSKVLELNPKNDRARHNLEYVKQLLQEQQQKESQNQQDQQNKNDQQQGDSQEQQTNSSRQKQNSSKSDSAQNHSEQQQNQDKSDSSGNDQGSQQSSTDGVNSHKQQSKDESVKKQKDDTSSEAQSLDKDSRSQSNKEDVADKLQKSKDRSSLDKDLKNNSQKDAQSTKDQPLGKKDDSKNAGSSKDAQDKDVLAEGEQVAQLQDMYASQMEQLPESDDRLDKRAVKVMRQLQEQEDYMQKQLLKMNVSKSGAFGYGQKNW